MNTKIIKNDGVINIPDVPIKKLSKPEISTIRDKVQSDVFLGHSGSVDRKHPDFYKLNIANYILGGSSLASRLSKKVRDDGGLVYTVYSYINASLAKGEFGLYFGSNNDNVDKSIKVIKEQLNKFIEDGISEQELKKAKAALIDSFVSRFLSTYRSISSTIVVIEFYGLGKNYINDYPKIINSLKLKDVNNAIKKHIHPEDLNISIAGGYRNTQKISKKK